MEQKTSSENVSVRLIRQSDITYVLDWSEEQKFCSSNGWKLNRNEEEIHKWWILQVTNDSAECIREGIEFEKRLVEYVDVTFIDEETVELEIAIGESELWGKGIGQQVYNHAVDYVKGRDMRKIRLSVIRENEPAVRMWKKQGFETIDEEVTEYGVQLMMELRL